MRALQFLCDTAIDLCLGCRHEHLTRLFTIEDQSYMVCLDCGKQVFYSVETMRRLSSRELRNLRAARSSIHNPAHLAGSVSNPRPGPSSAQSSGHGAIPGAILGAGSASVYPAASPESHFAA